MGAGRSVLYGPVLPDIIHRCGGLAGVRLANGPALRRPLAGQRDNLRGCGGPQVAIRLAEALQMRVDHTGVVAAEGQREGDGRDLRGEGQGVPVRRDARLAGSLVTVDGDKDNGEAHDTGDGSDQHPGSMPTVRSGFPALQTSAVDSRAMQLGNRTFDFSRQVAVMAIVNRTPDSFFDRGRTFALHSAIEHALAQVEEGADLVDVGGVRAGPGEEVPEDVERDRILPFVEAFRRHSDVPLSIDTFRARIAKDALAAGADLINDVSGMVEPEIADVVAAHPGAALVVMHPGGPPRTRPHRPVYLPDVTTVVVDTCRRLAEEAQRRGVPRTRLIVDPGHDFGKNTQQSLEVTRRLPELAALGYPVLVALSNKDFLGETLDLPVTERLEASLAAAVSAVMLGARIVRAHATRETVRALRTVEAILGWRPPAVGLRGLD
jgi:dihydropteroate synthase